MPEELKWVVAAVLQAVLWDAPNVNLLPMTERRPTLSVAAIPQKQK